MASTNRPSKKERQESARDKARQMAEQQRQREKRNQMITIWSIVGAVVVVVAIVVGVIWMNSSRSIPTTGPAPAFATEQGGVVLTSTTEIAEGADMGDVDVESVGEANVGDGQPSELEGAEASAEGEPVSVIVYADPNCVHCADFEQTNGEQLNEWLDAGDITLEYRLVNFLDSPGTENYSSRAANAAMCVAEESPESYNDFLTQIYASYDGQGLSNSELKEMASGLGVNADSCIDGNTYRPFVDYTSDLALADGVAGIPSVWVQGNNWAVDGADQGFAEWTQSIIDEHQGA
ncbi:MAG: DsbA family protein [Micrococcaceae bacterium]